MTVPDPAATPAIAGIPGGGRLPRTVLQVLPALGPGGVERGTVDIAAGLVASGWRAIVASEGGPLVAELERLGGRHVTLPLASKRPWTIRANAARLAALAAAEGVDIIHARSRAPAWSAEMAAARMGAAFVTTFHGTYGHGSWLKRRYNAVMTRGRPLIAISGFIADHLRQVYDVDPAVIRTIPRGVDIARFHPASVPADRIIALARRWRLDETRALVLMPGRLSRWKGHMVMLDALAALGRRDIQCVMVGAAPGTASYRAEIEQGIRARGLQDVVGIAEAERDMPAAYMLADVVVSPATEPEAFGRIPVEAQAMGRWIIATDHGGARETVDARNVGGALVPPGDAGALAQALAAALDMPGEVRARAARAMIAHVDRHFTLARMQAATRAVYDEALLTRAAVPRIAGVARIEEAAGR
ncbi:glycosyltransferase family 4 protein [Tistrella bauzanensis]|uniref:glycosyltransferase family 4 protein n=1 Tax=Tistrella TaxID=171436 RepID=UPI0031F6072F